MNGKKGIRRKLAFLLTIVLVVSGIMYTPKKVKGYNPPSGTFPNSTYPNTGVVGSLTTIGTDGWQYYMKSASTTSLYYGGGTSFSDGPRFAVFKSTFVGGEEFYAISPKYTVSTTGIYNITLINNEQGDTSSSYIQILNNSGDIIYQTDNYGTISSSTPARYVIKYARFEAGEKFSVKYIQNYASQGTKALSVSVTQVNPNNEVNPQGRCGNNAYWTYNVSTGQMNITGSGPMYSYANQESSWKEIRPCITSVNISEGITSIGSSTFSNVRRLQGNLTIPNSVTTIEDNAFYYCKGLTGNLIIPNSVTSIGKYAFYYCSGFTGDLTIPNSVTSIGEYAFYFCTGFNGTLTLSNSLTSIPNYAFYYCTKFSGSVTFPSNISSIGRCAFYSCYALTDAYIYNPSCNISSGSDTFYRYTRIHGYAGSTAQTYASSNSRTFIEIEGVPPTTAEPTTVQATTVQPTTVQPTTVQPTTVQPTTVQTVFTGYCGSTANGAAGTNLQWSLNTTTGILTITGSGVMQNYTSSSNAPWYDKKASITSLVLPSGITKIGNYAFYDCSSITGNLTIPSSVTYIGSYAFYRCSGLTGSLTIPNSVTSIGSNAFYGCSGFKGNLTISNSITAISVSTFNNCSGFTGNLTIPSSVRTIGNSAFYGCYNFTGSLTIPNNVTSIGTYSFYNCNRLSGRLTLSNSMTSISNNAFRYCRGLTMVDIPENITAINNYAFASTGLSEINIPSTVTTIGQDAFSNCSSMTDIYIYNTGCSIYDAATTIYSGTTVHGYTGSTAQTYATTYSRTFVPLDEPTTVQPTTVQPTTVQPTTVQPTTVEPTTNASSVDADFKIVSKTLALSSGISLVFKVNKSLFENGYSQPKVVVLLDGFETEITEYTDEGNRYAFEFTKITPDKMNVMVNATLHATKNGREYVSPVTEYSVATYVYNMLNKYGTTTGMESFRTLLVDLLNYGAASQNYTGYNTNNLANADLTSTQRSWATASVGNLISVKNNKYQTITSPSVLWKSAGLALQDAVIVKMKIQADSIDGLVVRVTDDYGTIWNIEPEDFELASGTVNQYYISFKGFNVGRMSESMYFTVLRNGVAVSNTYRYSVESYVLQYMNNGDSLAALVTAMMKYGKSAHAYSS